MDYHKLVFSIIAIIIGLVFFFKPSILEWRFEEFLDDKRFIKKIHILAKVIGITFFSLGVIFLILTIVSGK